jgi:hypothetical protein
MYEKIAARKSVPRLYEEKLVVSCVSSPDELAFDAPNSLKELFPPKIFPTQETLTNPTSKPNSLNLQLISPQMID